MKCEVVPSEISNLIPFSSSSYSSRLTENVENTFGLISKNGLWLYLVHDTVINIYCTESGKWCGGHCFGESVKNPSAKITAVVEFTSSHISFPCLLVAVNQDHESLVCMFDVNVCEVVRAILVPDRVTSLDVVNGNGGVCVETQFLSRRLRYMFGIIAVGTLHGHVFFLDLCLDEDFNCDERLPNITAVVKNQDFSAQKREAVIAKKQHIFLHLNVDSTCGGSFEFKSQNSTLGRFPNGEVYVTAVKYIQSLTTLAVGFNFGGIQLWELHHLTLHFTISNDQHELSVVNFAFQEPENDPRNFCYLWVIKGHCFGEEEPPSSVSVASLYSLTYYKRDYIESFGALYTELQSCNKRFEFPLVNNAVGSVNNYSFVSRLISCQVISQKDTHALDAGSPNESDAVVEDMSLCFLSWESCPESDHLPSSYHLAVFDLNQWYQAHMPFSFKYNPNELSSYFGIFSLDEVANRFRGEGILGLYNVPQSVKKFKSLSVSEEFFYPSSLSFQLLCFSETGLCKTVYFGLQKRILYEFAELGPQALLNPKEIYSCLIRSGLIADTHGGTERTPLIIQKEALLQLALEYHLPFFFMKCLKEWRYGESIHECCTSKSLLSWAWKRVISIKNSIDRFTLPLFNCSGSDVDKASLKYLYSFRRQLSLIDSIMAGYQKYVTPRTEQGAQELQCRRNAISSVNLYLQVLLWLRSVHILPEVCEEETTLKAIVYRLSHLGDAYSLKRQRLQKLHSSLSPTDVLLIDGMVSESGISSSWVEKGGSGIYPPPSIYAALSSYLLEGSEQKHTLMYYLLLDLRDMNVESPFPVELKKFPAIFGMSKSNVKLIKAFWYLDRKDSERAIKKLLHPAVKNSDILPWQHQRIIKSFLYWRAPQKALKYINHMEPPQVTLDDLRLRLSVLLSCGAITQAYEFQRKKQQQGYGNELLNHLFLGCQEMRKLKDLMYLPLNSFESWTLMKFLSESEDPRAQESLVMYHLLHCNFFEATKVNDKLSRSLMKKPSSGYEATIYERGVDREALVESLMAAVPYTEKCLVEEIQRLPSEMMKVEEIPQPLSISIKCDEMEMISYSKILQSLVCKTVQAASNPEIPSTPKTRTYFEDLPFVRAPVTPECVRQPLAFDSGRNAIGKRSLLSTSPTEYASPAKRSRLLEGSPFKPSPLTKRNTPRNLAVDIVSLLQTPPICRRTSSVSKNRSLQGTPTITPQSILKKKTESKKQLKLDFHTAPTPPLVSEDESIEDEVMQVDEKNLENTDDKLNDETPSRQIRFDLPVEEQQVREPSVSPDLSCVPVALQKKTSVFETPLPKTYNIAATKFSASATPKESAKSISNLTREPLRSRRKEISFKEEVAAIAEPEAVENFESSEVSKELAKSSLPSVSFLSESIRPKTSNLESSSLKPYFEGPPLISEPPREVETELPLYSLAFDSGIATSTQFFPQREDPLPSGTSFPQVLDDIEVVEISDDNDVVELSDDNDVVEIPVERSCQQSFQRSDNLSFFPPLRSDPRNKYLLKTQEEYQNPDSESNLQCLDRSVSTDIRDYTPVAVPAFSLGESTTQERILMEELSDEESFYSPCADPQNLSRASFTFAEPVTLFPENSSSLEDKPREERHSSVVESGNYCTETVGDTNIPPLFTFSEPSIDNVKDTNITPFFSVVEPLMDNAKNTSIIPFFTFSEPSMDNADIEMELEDESQNGSEPQDPKTEHKDFPNELSQVGESLKPPRRTFVFTKLGQAEDNSANISSQAAIDSSELPKETYAPPKDADEETESLGEGMEVQDAENESNLKIEIQSSVNVVDRAAPKYTFTFTKISPKELSNITAVQLSKTIAEAGQQSIKTTSSEMAESSAQKSTRTSRKTFVFGKKDPPKDNSDGLQTKQIDLQGGSKDKTTSDAETVVSLPDVELQPTLKRETKTSRKTFVFTKLDSDSHLKQKDSQRESKIHSKDETMPDAQKEGSLSNVQLQSANKKETRTSSKKSVSYKAEPTNKGSKSKVANLHDFEMQTSKSFLRDKVDFLETTAAESYEEFSELLKKNNTKEESQEKDDTKTLLSSPHQLDSEMSASDSQHIAGTSRSSKVMKDKLIGTTPSLTKKKKGKRIVNKGSSVPQKIEFSFAEPTSPATPEILQALLQKPETPDQPLPTFMFSPPLTRGRLRKKRMDDTMGSSFCSVASESSFARPRTPPPMDSILEGIVQEKKLSTRKGPKSKSATSRTTKRSSVKKQKPSSRQDVSDKSLLMASFLDESKSSPSKRGSTSPKDTSLRHSMVLRQTKAKPRPDSLY